MLETMTEPFNPLYISDSNFKVTFQKVNGGEVRTMTCNFFDKPVSEDDATAFVATLQNKDLVTVFDLDAGKWKSFYQSKVISWELI